MAMGTRRQRRRQESLWISVAALPGTAAHPFYQRLNDILDDADFDAFVEQACETFHAPTMGRPSLAPGIYFRLLLIGYFEGVDSERGIAQRLHGAPIAVSDVIDHRHDVLSWPSMWCRTSVTCTTGC